ncbi:MAG: glycosyltransferase family 2 protein [Tissierellales bacterium]
MDCLKPRLIAVIPVYNEESNIESTISNIKKIKFIDEIIVVDDGSTDRTREIASMLDITLIKINNNRGKGYAIKKAIENTDFNYLLLIDGDLGKTSNEVIKLILPAINNEADVIIARFQKARKKGGFGLVKKLANKGVYFYTGKNIGTTLSGQRVYNRKAIESINYIPDRFGVEVAMTVGVLRNGFTIKEIDVSMTHRETERNFKGFIHRGKQFANILMTLINLGFRR